MRAWINSNNWYLSESSSICCGIAWLCCKNNKKHTEKEHTLNFYSVWRYQCQIVWNMKHTYVELIYYSNWNPRLWYLYFVKERHLNWSTRLYNQKNTHTFSLCVCVCYFACLRFCFWCVFCFVIFCFVLYWIVYILLYMKYGWTVHLHSLNRKMKSMHFKKPIMECTRTKTFWKSSSRSAQHKLINLQIAFPYTTSKIAISKMKWSALLSGVWFHELIVYRYSYKHRDTQSTQHIILITSSMRKRKWLCISMRVL